MGQLGAPELIIILLIVIVLFGASRVADIGSALGRGIRDFKRGIRDDESATNNQEPGTRN
jgi:sec-independent protein translocase protein TatA